MTAGHTKQDHQPCMTAIETLDAGWTQDYHRPLHPEAGTAAVGRSLLLDGAAAVRQLGTEFCKGFWEMRKKVKDLTEGL